MRILVTGNKGFIGQHIESMLLADGHDVRGCDRKNNVYEDLLQYKTTMYWIYLTKFNPDVIIHLAGSPRIQRAIADPVNTFDDNVVGTRNILEFARVVKPKLFIYAGSSSSKGMPQNPYSWQKKMGEMLCRSYEQTYGVRTCCVNFHNVFHEEQLGDDMHTSTLIGIWRKRAMQNKPLMIYGDGTQRRDFTHIIDVYNALKVLIDTSIEKNIKWHTTLDIGNGVNYSVNELKDIILTADPTIEFKYDHGKTGEQNVTLADISALLSLGWKPKVNVPQSIIKAFKNVKSWHKKIQKETL